MNAGLVAWAALVVLGLSTSPASAQWLDLVEPPTGYRSTVGHGLSDDGTTIAGWSNFNDTVRPGFVYRRGGTRFDFGLQSDFPRNTQALGLSGDGGSVVGVSSTLQPLSARAFRYQVATNTFESLGLFAGMNGTFASDANRDGSVVVGWGVRPGGFETTAFRWTSERGFQPIGWFSRANAVSSDGQVVVGDTGGPNNPSEAFAWTAAGGLSYLENPGTPGDGYATAQGTNSTGSMIVGISSHGLEIPQATVWRDGIAERLERWGNLESAATCTSDDGSVIGGYFDDGGTSIGCVWTREAGIERFADYLARHGVILPAGVVLSQVQGISADGRTFSGNLSDPALPSEGRAFIATIPAPATLLVMGVGVPCATRRRRFRSCVALGVLWLSDRHASGQTLDLVEPPSGYHSTVGHGLSDDGTTIAGWSTFDDTIRPGFAFSLGNPRLDFGLHPGMPRNTLALGLSGDGGTIVGASSTGQPFSTRAYRYVIATNTLESLGLFSGMVGTQAHDASRDGSVVVGWGVRSLVETTAFCWTAAQGYQTIGRFSRANAVSGDGRVVVGDTASARNPAEAFAWTSSGGLTYLENPGANGDGYASAAGANSSGSIIVGITARGLEYSQATVWRSGVVERLQRWGDLESAATCTSEDGSVIGGSFVENGVYVGCVWTREAGVERLSDFLTRHGVTLPAGTMIAQVEGISADGRTFSGNSWDAAHPNLGRAFIATIPTPSAICAIGLGTLASLRRRR